MNNFGNNIEYDISAIEKYVKISISIDNINNSTELITIVDMILSDTFKIIELFRAKLYEYKANNNLIKMIENDLILKYYMEYVKDATETYENFCKKIKSNTYSKNEYENAKSSFNRLNNYNQGLLQYLK